jgi:hypothetical protein
MVFLSQKSTSASTRWAFPFAMAALGGFPLLPGFFFTTHLLALTFANVGLWIGTALAILAWSIAAARTIHLWQRAPHPSKNNDSNRLLVPMAIGGILFGILSLSSPPLVPLFLESVFGPPEPVSLIWFLVAAAIIGSGAWLGYWLASGPEIPFLCSLSQIANTRRLRDTMARLFLAIGMLISTWEKRLADWTWGRLARWMISTEDESR